MLNGEEIVGIRDAGFADVQAVVDGGAEALDRVQQWLLDPPWSEIAKAADVALRAPLMRPPKIICVGLNYRAHAIESKMENPQVPTIFAKFFDGGDRLRRGDRAAEEFREAGL